MSDSARTKALVDELNSAYIRNGAVETPFAPPRFFALQAEASEKSSIEETIRSTVATFGRLDVVASNSGWTRLTNLTVWTKTLMKISGAKHTDATLRHTFGS
jgi:NAD(P)-dependent dehydrogenase (short-subunit alcohol dehydrogenase family)